jgi:cytochrome b
VNISTSRIRIWDLPTRTFHWALVVCVTGLIVTGKVGGEWLAWHFRLGFTVFALLLFRLVWGFIGGRWSRFSSFLYAPGTVLRYLRGQGDALHEMGHSPLGAGSVFMMLLVLAAQVGSGLFADDEIATTGPLARFVSTGTSLLLTSYHRHVGQWVILALVALHIGAIAYYRLAKGRNLVGPMIHGDKLMANAGLAAPTLASSDGTSSRVMALILLGVCAGVVAWVVSLGG